MITHNLGIVDRKYLERLQSAEREGREIRIRPEDISTAIKMVLEILASAHRRLFVEDNSKRRQPASKLVACDCEIVNHPTSW